MLADTTCRLLLVKQLQSEQTAPKKGSDLFSLCDLGIVQRQLDAGGHPQAIRPGICHVVRIAVDCAPQVLTDDVGPSLLRMGTCP